MGNEAEPRTRASLLARLGCEPLDQAAWNEFVECYAPRIYSWCRHHQLQEADAQDITQNVLLKLAVEMKTFRYDPSRSFRGWLRTLTHNVWYQFVTSRKTANLSPGTDEAARLLDSLEARDDLVNRFEERFDLELLEGAFERVRQRVSPRTWQAFCLLTKEGVSGAEAAQQLDMKVANVFVAKSRVQKLLQEDVRQHEDVTP